MLNSEKEMSLPEFKSVVMQGKLEEGDDRRLKIREMQVIPGFLGPYTLEDKAGGKHGRFILLVG